ncbi:MAG: CpsB/CapC family capsule biosynthesis tyrosine phosphatase [Finegoldia sp.]|nr:CpsB/CapC family capsule biosynthesis tyrosine phosphatase [Finegoldia sp.]
MIDINSRILGELKNGSIAQEQGIMTAMEYGRLGYDKLVSASELSFNTRPLNHEEKQYSIDRFNEALQMNGVDVEILTGNLIDCNFDNLKYLDQGYISSVNYSRYLLVQLPSAGVFPDLNEYIYELELRGYVPIICHPERCIYVQEDTDYLLELKYRNCLIQISLSSLSKKFDSRSFKCARELLNRSMVDLVGSEVENSYEVADVLGNLKNLRKMVDVDYYDILTKLNPELVIEDEYVDRLKALDKNAKSKKRGIRLRRRKG